MWGAACVVCEEGGEAAGGRLSTCMALSGLKVLVFEYAFLYIVYSIHRYTLPLCY